MTPPLKGDNFTLAYDGEAWHGDMPPVMALVMLGLINPRPIDLDTLTLWSM